MFFLVLLPTEVRFEMPGALPELTAHRAILLFVLWNSVSRLRGVWPPPFSGILLLLGLVAVGRLCSTLMAQEPVASFKTLFGFLIETVLYYVLVLAALSERRTLTYMVRSALLALVVISMLATVERYTSVNLAARVVAGMVDSPQTVSATFRHRILLGYAMAMAFPLALALQGMAENKRQQWIAQAGALCLGAACYFSNSRGPWVGFALGGVIMLFLGGRGVARKLRWVAVVAVVVLVARPGVWDTISTLWKHSFDEASLKGRSASYRIELWRVAYGELSKSPERLLLGYGGNSTRTMDLGDEFERGAGGGAGELGHTSWDSQFASNFVQYGSLGLALEALLYFSILRFALRAFRASVLSQKELAAACVAAIAVFIWAMSNVAIFSPQLQFMFWALVAIIQRLGVLATDLESAAETVRANEAQQALADWEARFELG